MANGDGITILALFLYGLAFLLSLAWIGTLIWAVIYVLTHIGGWIG